MIAEALEMNETQGIKKLVNTENYQLWKFQMDILLESTSLLEMVDGSKPKPEDRKAAPEWLKKDARVKAFITNTVDPTVLIHLMVCKTSFEMYEALRKIFQRDTSRQKFTMLGKFYNFKWDNNKNTAVNIAELKNIVFILASLGEKVNDPMIVTKLISSLPDSFKNFTMAWQSTPHDAQTLENLISRLAEMEDTEQTTTEAGVAFKTSQDTSRVKCFKCNKMGHYAKDCKRRPQSTNAPMSPMPCRICRRTNHKERDCFFLDKRQSKEKGNNDIEKRKGMSFHSNNDKVAFFINDSNVNKALYLDSGSSHHLVNDLSLLTNVINSRETFKTANAEELTSVAKGDIELDNCILKDVSYCPTLSHNLVSVSKIINAGGTVTFANGGATISKNNEILMTGTLNNNLFVINKNKTDTQNAVLLTHDAYNWHHKLGHLGLDNMKKLKDMADGIDFKNIDKLNCETCILAKHPRSPFSSELPTSTRVNQIVHSDVCYVDPVSYNGKQYFITILDDFSHRCEVHSMQRKSEAAGIIQEYITRVENLHGEKVCTLKTDNGREYLPLINWCKQRGISMDFSPPYSPQNNGKAERLNRTLCEKTRALLFESGLNKGFWTEAINVAAYVTNRSPSNSKRATPEEIWSGKRPDLRKLKIFGSTAYAKSLTPLKKMEERSKKMTFVGYANCGYRLWDGEKIIISRDVVFVEKQKDIDFEHNSKSKETYIHIQNTENDNEDNEDTNTIENEIEEVTPGPSTDTPEPISSRLRDRNQLKAPSELQDYITDLSNITNIAESSILLTFKEALDGDDSEKWKKAIHEEKMAILNNETWNYVDAEEARGRKILTSKWIFRVKDNGRYKARLCARGFMQTPGQDFEDTYSPVVNFSSLRTLFAIAATENLNFQIFDITSAFLNGKIEEDIYMEIPEGFEKKTNKICKLNKSLYGLKQAPLNWNKTFTEALEKLGLQQLVNDPCIYKCKGKSLYLAIHVDDGILFGTTEDINTTINELKKFFKLTTSNSGTYLGVQLRKEENGMKISQEKYILEILAKYKMQESKPMETPITKQDDSSNEDDENRFPYRECVGSLLYLTKTRPDIAYAVGYAGRANENPTTQDIKNIKRILRYLKGTSNLGLHYKRGNITELITYSDADLGGDPETKRSTSGIMSLLNGTPVSWQSRRQPTVALSSTESELIAAAEAAKEIAYLQALIFELTGKTIINYLNIDNQSTIHLIKNRCFTTKSKHIDRKIAFIFENYSNKLFTIRYCPSEDQWADILTKPLGRIRFKFLRDKFCKNVL